MLSPELWIEAHHYGRRVLARNVEPWLEPMELGLFYRQLAELLRPELIELPLLPLMQAHVPSMLAGRADPERAVRMIAEPIEAERFREAMHAGLSAVAGGAVRCPVALALPGPAELLTALAPDAAARADQDDLDELATLLSALLRAIGGTAVPRLILHESSDAALAACDVLMNVTRDYRVPLTLITRLPGKEISPAVESVIESGVAVAWQPDHECRRLDERLWTAPDAADRSTWRGARIIRIVVPEDIAPERVMQALRILRESH